MRTVSPPPAFRRRFLTSIVAALLAVGGLWPAAAAAADRAASPDHSAADASDTTDARDTAAAIASRIDAAVESRWASDGITPTEPASDSDFLRRASLDLTGRIPTVAEARDFLDDPTPSAEKRRQLVRRLFDDPTHLVHQTNVWRTILIPEAGTDLIARQFVPEFEDWLRRRLLAGQSYDELVREVLCVPRLQMSVEAGPSQPRAFFEIRQDQPDRVAAATSRAFLGVRLECAQCHDHPFDDWRQDQFWQLAAFFAPAERFDDDGNPIVEIAVPETDRTVQAAFLDGGVPEVEFDARRPLAEWITDAENPYFAAAIANRMWALFLGAGLVEPVDDFSPYNEPTHPELLDVLAEGVREAGFDLDVLAEAIVLSRPYGLSSRTADDPNADPADLARMAVRALTPEQLYDSLTQATGRLRPFDPAQAVNFNNDQDRSRFLERFARESMAARDQPSSILQALMMMNGEFIGDATRLEEGRTLTALAEAPFLSDDDRIDVLYLAAYARRPTQSEQDLAQAYLASSQTPREGLADLFWALLNSSEFLFNH